MTNPSEILDPKLIEAVELIQTASAVAVATIGDDLATLCNGCVNLEHFPNYPPSVRTQKRAHP